MEPMDYTMDDHSNQQSNNSHRHQCQQPHFPSNANPFTSQGREGQHYDPVHDSSSWYQSNNSNAPTRSPYAPPPNTTPWPSHSFMPINNWGLVADVHRSTAHISDPSGVRASRDAFDHQWSTLRNFDYPHGYNSYAVSVSSSQTDSGPGGIPPLPQPSSTLATTPQSIPSSNYAPGRRHDHISGMHQRILRDNQLNEQSTSDSARRQEELLASERANRHQPPSFTPENRTPDSRAAGRRTNYIARTNMPPEPPHSRRRTSVNTWDSDDDDGENTSETFRRQAELLFNSDIEDERQIQAMRGAIAASGKRVPSKDALASLEPVKVEDLPADSKDCKICYNDYGVMNPEGILEQPLRLPKCKHIFGNKCIKKWFEDNDSCPYCRDKLPSEVAIRRSGFEAYRQARERAERALSSSHRPRHGIPHPRLPLGITEESGTGRNSIALNAAQRAQEDYEFALSRNVDPWGHSSSNRPSPGDPSERRRQARGRAGSNRAAHLLARPISVGSARALNPNHTHAPPRANVLALPTPPVNPFTITPSTQTQRSITPNLPRQDSSLPGSNAHTPERIRLPSSLLSSPSSSAEEASPPVAVGSGTQIRERQARQTERQLENNRRSLDAWTSLISPESNSSAFQSQNDSIFSISRAQPQPSTLVDIPRSTSGPVPSLFGADSPLRQHPMPPINQNTVFRQLSTSNDESLNNYLNYESPTDSSPTRWSR